MWSWIQNSNFVPLYCQCTHQGEDWEIMWSVHWFDLWWVIDLPCFEFESRKFWWSYPTISFIWRNMFTCLMMCRWQVRHGGQQWGSRQKYYTWCRGPGMVKHRSGTRWSNDREVRWYCERSTPCTRRWWAQVSWFSLKTKVDGFSQFGLKTGGYGSCDLASNHSLGFPGLDLKTGSYGLVIWPTKSPRQFLGLDIKTKWVMVCQLCHKPDGRMKMVQGTRQDLAACFICKRVRLGFPSLASRLAEARFG
jgi:hypothetical protein